MKVYLSSTYQDLKDYRAAAARAVRKLNLEAVGMEDYRASESPPLETCRQDVRRCDLYVGIFAWRVGFKPEGQRESITTLEYREARAAKKPCFIFLLDESFEWPADQRDADETEIRAFRAEVSTPQVVARFTTHDNLQSEVTAALAGYSRADRHRVPELLPWMADRTRQERELRALLERAQARGTSRPCLMVLHGHEREAHHNFLQRIARHTLPAFLGDGENVSAVHEYATPWATARGDLSTRAEDLIDATEGQLRLRRAAGEDQRRLRTEWLSKHRGAVVVSTSVHTHEWRPDEDRLIERWAAWWSEWPEPPPDRPLVVALEILYREPAGFLERMRWKRKHEAIRESLARVVGRFDDTLHAHLLTELTPVTQSDVNDWIDRHVPRWLGEHRARMELLEKLRERARSIFQKDAERGLPMEEVGKHLHDALSTLLAQAI